MKDTSIIIQDYIIFKITVLTYKKNRYLAISLKFNMSFVVRHGKYASDFYHIILNR